jgi:DNA-binding CsgD family transcriptional regulator
MRAVFTEDLIERDREVAAIDGCLTEAAAGRGSVVVIDGPPGIGKSRLLDWARETAIERGAGVLSARGVELERDVPFGVVGELFGARLAASARREREGLLAGHAGLAAAVLDPSAPPPAEAQALVRGLYWLTVNLAAAASPGPLLMLVDDVQWADRPSLAFIAHLAVRVRELSVAIVVATRDGERDDASDHVEWLLSQPEHTVLRPLGLSEPGVGQMVAAELPEAEPAFVHACAQVSGGNPFLARELLRSLRADGIPPTVESVPTIERLVPASVVQSVLVRLARLGSSCQRLAGAVAVLGGDAAVRHAAALAELELAAAEQAADRLADAHVLAAGAPLRFTHPLIASAVSADRPAFARARAHRHAAALLAADGAAAEVVCVHLLRSEPEAQPSTVATLRQAATRGLARGDAPAAVHLLRRALAEPPSPEMRSGVLLELAEAEMQSGHPGAGTHIDAALTLLREPADRIEALALLARLRFQLGQHEASARALQEALELVDDDDPLAQALIADELSATLFQAPLRARASARVAPLLAAARNGETPEHPGLLAHLALRLALAGGTPAQVRALAEEATADNPLVDSASYGMLMGIVVQALACVDELDVAEQIATVALALATRRGSLLTYASASFHRAIPRYHRGALDDALADLDQALTAKSEGWDAARGWIGALQAHIQIARGDLAAAHQALALGEGVAPTSLDHPIVRFAHAQLALAERAPAVALAEAEAVGRQLIQGFGIDHPGFIAWRSTASEAALALGQHDRAERLANDELVLAQASGVPRAIGRALRSAARVADGERSIALLHDAITVLGPSPSVLERAEATVGLGAALRRAGQRVAARTPLRTGLQLADAIGAAPLAETARQELRATGARPRRAAWTGAGALTPTERRVALLATDDLTNPQIAQALFVTSKTIQTHLAHTYRKLGINSRHQLAKALAQEPTPDTQRAP